MQKNLRSNRHTAGIWPCHHMIIIEHAFSYVKAKGGNRGQVTRDRVMSEGVEKENGPRDGARDRGIIVGMERRE